MYQVQTKAQLIQLLQRNRERILAFGVLRIGIFGSFVRNEAREESDIDFLVEFDPAKKNLANFIGLADLLDGLTGRRTEIVTPESLSKYIGPSILKEVEYVPLAA